MLLFLYKNQIIFKSDIMDNDYKLRYPKGVLVKELLDDINYNWDKKTQFYNDLREIDIFNKLDIELNLLSLNDVIKLDEYNYKNCDDIRDDNFMSEYGYLDIFGDDGKLTLNIINLNEIKEL